MRILKWIFGLVVLLGVVFIAGAYLLPRNVQVARSIDINAPADQVFQQVNSLKATQNWSPWLSLDPDVALTFNDVETGVGSAMSWTSENPKVGSGAQEITASVENQSVTTALDFGDMGTANAEFLLKEADGITNITWTLDADMGNNPIGRWMGLKMDDWVGADYEKGLGNLKALVEGS